MATMAFMDRARAPTAREIIDALGPVAPLWESLTGYLDRSYAIEPTLVPPGRTYGWEVKYRKGGRTLVSLAPDEGRFTALVVLGANEAESAFTLPLGRHVRGLLEQAKPYHDGRWLFIPVRSERDVRDIEALLTLKRRPS